MSKKKCAQESELKTKMQSQESFSSFFAFTSVKLIEIVQ